MRACYEVTNQEYAQLREKWASEVRQAEEGLAALEAEPNNRWHARRINQARRHVEELRAAFAEKPERPEWVLVPLRLLCARNDSARRPSPKQPDEDQGGPLSYWDALSLHWALTIHQGKGLVRAVLNVSRLMERKR